jgi:hypothetical protein
VANPRPQVITARVLYEAGSESQERTRGYVVQALKSACRNIRDGNVSIALYDEDDNLIGMDVTGTPSETLQNLLDDLFESYEGRHMV